MAAILIATAMPASASSRSRKKEAQRSLGLNSLPETGQFALAACYKLPDDLRNGYKLPAAAPAG
jgi:hypothetical protein